MSRADSSRAADSADDHGDLELNLTARDAIWLTAAPEILPADLENFAVERPDAICNPYGLKYVDEDWLIDSPDIAKVQSALPRFFIE